MSFIQIIGIPFDLIGRLIRKFWESKIRNNNRTIEIDGKAYNYKLDETNELVRDIIDDTPSSILDTIIGIIAFFVITIIIITLILFVDAIS